MLYKLEVPDSFHRRIEERANREGISARALLVWWIKTRLDDLEAADVVAAERAERNDQSAVA